MQTSLNKENILILIQGSQRSIYIESLIFELQDRGYNVALGAIGISGSLQEYLKNNGVKCYEFNTKRHPLLRFYLSNIKFWISIVNTHEITYIFSHLQWANFIALMIGILSFNRIKIIPTRHHIDASFLHNSKNAQIEDATINLLSKKQVVVSNRGKKFMIQNEYFARKSKIYYIPLGYRFENYLHLSSGKETSIRSENKCNFLLVSIARLIKTKRHKLLIEAMKILRSNGLDIKLMILDDGPEKDELENLIKLSNLNTSVKMYGHQKYVVDYIRASDLVILPSLEESSNQVVKEAAVNGKTVVVTKGIGDFDDYIIDKTNAFFINETDSAEELANLIEEIYKGKYNLQKMSEELRNEVLKRFAIKHTVDEYLRIAELI